MYRFVLKGEDTPPGPLHFCTEQSRDRRCTGTMRRRWCLAKLFESFLQYGSEAALKDGVKAGAQGHIHIGHCDGQTKVNQTGDAVLRDATGHDPGKMA